MSSSPSIRDLLWQLAAAVSHKCWQEPVYKKIFLFLVAVWLVRDYIRLCSHLQHYLWTETFINYAGGFMRRGLLGQLLYYAAPWINIRFLAVFACTAAFLVFVKLAYDRISVSFDKLSTIIIFITPAYFLFFVKDWGAFLRKDQFINLLALVTIIATTRLLKKESTRLWLATIIFCACFWTAFFIHEATVFYFTLPAWLLGLAFSERKKTWVWLLLMSVFFLLAGYIAVRFQGTAENARFIREAWQAFYPDFEGKGALDYLGMSTRDLMAETSAYHHNAVAVRSAVWGLFLAMLPLAWTCVIYRPFARMRKTFSPFMLFLLPFAAAAPWALPVFACDFGRHIALACIQYILLLWAMGAILRLEPNEWLKNFVHRVDTDAKTRVWTLAAVVLYGTSWTLMPWVPVGHSFVIIAGIPEFVIFLFATMRYDFF